jgi:hypothetical protein
MNGAFPLEITHIEAREHPEWHALTHLPHGIGTVDMEKAPRDAIVVPEPTQAETFIPL